MIYVLIFIMLFMKESQEKWNLVFNDEFESQTLDLEKWEPENEQVSCHGNGIGQLNCYTDSTENLRLINGTLAITAIYGKYLDKDYTSAKIITKQSFTYGRFEIRAALPEGKMLRSAIYMIPLIISDWSKDGRIDIVNNAQTSKLESGLHYDTPAVFETYKNREFTSQTSLNYFHTYAIEWNQFEIKWFFDDINHLTININRTLGSIHTKNGEPFDSPFRLLIHLGVGGLFFPNQTLTVEDVMDWKCSLLIIDYVRIYEWVNGTKILDSKGNRVSTDNICSHVMPLIKPKKKENLQFSAIVIIFFVISSSLIIILISIIVFLFIRQKKLERIKVENSYENYNYIFDTEGNDAFNTSCEYEYRYEEISVNYVGNDEIAFKQNLFNNPIYSRTYNKT